MEKSNKTKERQNPVGEISGIRRQIGWLVYIELSNVPKHIKVNCIEAWGAISQTVCQIFIHYTAC